MFAVATAIGGPLVGSPARRAGAPAVMAAGAASGSATLAAFWQPARARGSSRHKPSKRVGFSTGPPVILVSTQAGSLSRQLPIQKKTPGCCQPGAVLHDRLSDLPGRGFLMDVASRRRSRCGHCSTRARATRGTGASWSRHRERRDPRHGQRDHQTLPERRIAFFSSLARETMYSRTAATRSHSGDRRNRPCPSPTLHALQHHLVEGLPANAGMACR